MKTLKLSDLIKDGTFQTVTTDTAECYDVPFLEETMKMEAERLIKEDIENNHLPAFDIEELVWSINYSLSCSQGDGVSFREGSTDYIWINDWLSVKYYILTNSYASHYSHNRTFEVSYDLDCYDTYEVTEEMEKSLQLEADRYTENLRDICDKLEKYGYNCIDGEQESQNYIKVLEVFTEKNNIENLPDFFTESYEKDDQHPIFLGETDYTKCYSEDFELEEHTREVFEDGKSVRNEKFYSFK